MFRFVSNLFSRSSYVIKGQKNYFSTGIINDLQKGWNFAKFRSMSTKNDFIEPCMLPKLDRFAVGIWLASCSFMVSGAILIGGYTRLKNAGLSMVKWQLVEDMYLPSSEESWKSSYEEYKNFPEYNLSSDDITLEKYKKIYFLEWFHRIWGRATGLVFIVPAAILYAMGKLKGLGKKPLIYITLVALQGLMGWMMVKSGLDKETMSTHGEPGVSQYRLAAHLGLAFALFSLTTWQAYNYMIPFLKVSQYFAPKNLKPISILSHNSLFFIFLTCIYGAFVAGMDAGTCCNTYPLMNGKVIPNGISDQDTLVQNLFENPISAQFIHRVLGHIAAFLTILTSYKAFNIENSPKRLRYAALLSAGAVVSQIAFGVNAVYKDAAVEACSIHQFGAIVLFASVLWLAFEITRLKKGKLTRI